MLFLLSCQGAEHQDSYLKKLISSHNKSLKDVEVCYLIAQDRCIHCLDISAQFIRKHSNNPKILFIITNVIGSKELRLKYGQDFVIGENIIIDTKNIAIHHKMIESNPVVFFLDNHAKITKQISVSPSKLKNMLAEIEKAI